MVQMRVLLSNRPNAGIRGARPSITLEKLLHFMALKVQPIEFCIYDSANAEPFQLTTAAGPNN